MTEHLPDRLRRRLDAELAPDECVLWARRPNPRYRVGGDLILSFVGVVLMGLSALFVREALNNFGNPASVRHWPPAVLVLWGSLWLLVGIWLFLAVLRGWLQSRCTVYAITGTRALIIEASLRTATTRSFKGRQLDQMLRRVTDKGDGDLILWRELRDGGRRTHVYDVGFFGIDNVSQVHALVEALRG